jgi:hypothetical protein
MSKQSDQIIEWFDALQKNANNSFELYLENVENDWLVGSIFENLFGFC